jgi:CBS domain-containing protein/ribosome-associated translation inhibitor RaiA
MMERDTLSLSRSDSISKAISLLYTSGSYEALVKNGEFLGVVTVRDTLRVMNAERTSVARVLSKPQSISDETPLYDVILSMRDNGSRILPLIQDRSIIGVVRQSSILNKMADCKDLDEFTVEDLMIQNPHTIELNSSASITRNLMLSKGISHLPVVDQDDKLKGIITAKDLVWNFFRPRERVTVGERKGEKERQLKVSIKGIVDKHPLEVSKRIPLSRVVRNMVSQNKSYCLIVQEDKPIGILTPRDIIRILADFKPRVEIPLYIFGLEKEDEAQLELAKRKIERIAARGLKMHPDLLEIVVHGKISAPEGNKRKYEIKARAITPKETLAISATGWSLLDVFDITSDKMERRLKQVRGTRNKIPRNKSVSEQYLPT